MFLTKIIAFLAVFSISNINISFADCDLYELGGKDIGNVKEIPKGILSTGDSINIYCTRPYGSSVNGVVQSSFKVFCREGDYLELTGRCDLACDLSDVLASKNKVDLKKTKLTDGSPISISKLVPQNSKVNVVCLPDYTLELNSDPKQTEYTYECGKPIEQIFQCKANELIIEKKPPVSNQNTGFIPKLPCYASNINIPNGVIASSSISEYVAPGTDVEIKCQGGYAAFLGDKIIEKFKIQCDTNGKGVWQNTQACIKRCDVSSLAKASKVDINKVFFSASNNLVKNKNNSSNQIIYTNVGSKIDLHCNDGEEIRELGKSFYTTECLDGSNFSVGAKVPVCQKKIPPCNNSEIQVLGILQDNKLVNETTNIGQRVPFKCQGDGANQKGFYFKNGSNENKGDGGVPVCEYNESSKTSKWSHTTFKCYEGCISSDGDTKVQNQKTRIEIKKQLERAKVKSGHYLEGIQQDLKNPTKSKIGYGVNMDWPGFKDLRYISQGAPFDIYKNFTEDGILKGTLYRSDGDNSGDKPFGLTYSQIMKAYICKAPQTSLYEVTADYRFIKYATAWHKNSSPGQFLSWIGHERPTKHCTGSTGAHLNEAMGDECIAKLKADYGLQYGSADEVRLDIPLTQLPSNVSFDIDVCNKMLEKLTPIPSHSKCKGFGTYVVGRCANYSNRAEMLEEVNCTSANGTSVWGMRLTHSSAKNPGSIGSRITL